MRQLNNGSKQDRNQVLLIKKEWLWNPAVMPNMMQRQTNQGHNLHCQHLSTKDTYIIGNAWQCDKWQKNKCKIVIDNCAPCNISIDQNDVLATLDLKTGDLIPMEGSVKSSDKFDNHLKLPKVPKMSLRN